MRHSFLRNITEIGFAGFLGLTSCFAGEFKVIPLNNAPTYNQVHSNEDIKEVPFAYHNGADLRGDTLNLFTFISGKTSQQRAKAEGDYLKGAGIIGLGEMDYEDTFKTGFRNQPLDIANSIGPPYNYVVIDQYMKSPIWTTGNAMISKYPMKVIHRHLYGENSPLDTRLGHLFKDFIHVKVKLGKRKLNVILTHLDNEDNPTRREQELKELTNYVKGDILEENPDAYIALMLDANAGKDSREMKKLVSQEIFYPPEKNYGIPTHRSNNPAIDFSHVLATSNIKIEDYNKFCPKDNLGDYISDHCGVEGVFVFDS